jgi:hypothetical protein
VEQSLHQLGVFPGASWQHVGVSIKLLSFIFFLSHFTHPVFGYSYEVEFSIPKTFKPIPEGTVKVFFNLIEGSDVNADPEIEFWFENESLKHRKGNSMRSNMYESWINNVIEKKLKIKTELHLGSEFEHTRFVGPDGKMVDPFVPTFDIMKVKNFSA